MFAHKITLFRLFGFSISMDASWLILVVLVTWSLAQGALPFEFPGLAVSTYWWMGFAGAVGLFASIVLHELGHAIVARHFGIPIKDITLFIFGGVAEMEDEPPSARSEFYMAVAGPAISVLLAVGLFAAYRLGPPESPPSPEFAVAGYLAWLNGLLALFNLLPAFPLDGGRVLRSALWAWKENLQWATRIASDIGSFFGIGLIALGGISFVTGNLIGGIWWFMIGLFMRSASRASYKQVLMRKALEGESLRRFMKTPPIVVPADATIQDVVEKYVYRFHHRMFPVAENGRLLGCVSTRDIKTIPQEQWERIPVARIMAKCSETNSVGPDEDPMKALALMSRSGASRLLVVEDDTLLGTVALNDLLRFLSVKMDLEPRRLTRQIRAPEPEPEPAQTNEPPLWDLRTDFRDPFFDADEEEDELRVPHGYPKAHV